MCAAPRREPVDHWCVNTRSRAACVDLERADLVNHYNAAYTELGKIDKDVVRITGEGIGIEPLRLARPDREAAE